MKMPSYFVDAHHHLWDLNHCHYPWLMEKGKTRFFGDPTAIQRDYLVSDLQDDFDNLPIKKSVHIQVGVAENDSIRETRWLQDCANKYGYPNAIIAYCDLCAPKLDAILDQHAQCAAFRGVRQIVGRSAKEDAITGTASLLGDDRFIEGLQILANRGLSFDLQLTPALMALASERLSTVKGLKVALCHAGSPSDFSVDGLRQWRNGLERLADNPSLICKLSGFGMFNHDWTIDDVTPLIMSAVDIFGPERIAFGSNFPVDKLYGSYQKTMEAYLNIVQAFSAEDIDKMFRSTAEDFYRI